jgi:hypothetical protein
MVVQRIIFAFVIALLLSPLWNRASIGDARAAAHRLLTDAADPADVKGSFSVILLGGNHIDDLETAAFLDSEGDQYTLMPYAPDFQYTVKKGLPAQEALTIAQKFVSFHSSFWKVQLSKIIAPGDDSAGFELRPLYYPLIYGTSNVLDISYWLGKEGNIKVRIMLEPSIKSRIVHPGGDSGFGGSH